VGLDTNSGRSYACRHLLIREPMLRAIVTGILILSLTSCTAWTPITVAPATYIRAHDPAAIWVQLQDSSTLVLGRPRVFGDTLRGISGGVYRNVPLSQVAVLRAQGPAKQKTTIAVAASVVFVVGLVYVLATSDHVQP
jgi:hypothetical protein